MLLNAISLGLMLFAVIIIILGIVKIHTYPGKVAEARNHPQKDAIDVTSLLGLIIFPFWMFALVWAYSDAFIGVPLNKSGADNDLKKTGQDDGAADAKDTDPTSDPASGGTS